MGSRGDFFYGIITRLWNMCRHGADPGVTRAQQPHEPRVLDEFHAQSRHAADRPDIGDSPRMRPIAGAALRRNWRGSSGSRTARLEWYPRWPDYLRALAISGLCTAVAFRLSSVLRPRQHRHALSVGNDARRAAAGARPVGHARRDQHAGVRLFLRAAGVQLRCGGHRYLFTLA
jgi:hypothetical protein